MSNREPSASNPVRAPHAAIVYLSGHSRGRSQILGEDRATVGSSSSDVVRVTDHGDPKSEGRTLAVIAEASSDCIDCASHSDSGALGKVGWLVTGIPYELATEATPRARLAFFSLLVVMLAATDVALARGVSLERRLNAEVDRIAGLEALLAQTERAVYTRSDFEAARSEIDALIGESLGRVEALEERADATTRAIEGASRSVAFLQGAFGFVEPQSGRPLRFAVGLGGARLRLPDGRSAVTLDGDGPIVEIPFTGTGFVASSEGHLLTNRHVALPWMNDHSARVALGRGFDPVMHRFVAYLPGRETPFDLELVESSESSDVALLKLDQPIEGLRPLRLAGPMPAAGDDVIVLGYPTGMRAVIARAGEEFSRVVLEGGQLDFWQVAARLAEGGYLKPLATRGIVGQLTDEAIVYDAATIGGGSGGPVIDVRGEVVAINTAIIPGFGGSNLGVPASEAALLLDSAQPH